jgi:hypothetical protein
LRIASLICHRVPIAIECVFFFFAFGGNTANNNHIVVGAVPLEELADINTPFRPPQLMTSNAVREQKVVQCAFRSLGKAQREALMAILGSLSEDEITTMQHRAHGEVTLEWRVAPDHPILDILPEASVYSTAARSSGGVVGSSKANDSVGQRGAPVEHPMSSLSPRVLPPAQHAEQRILRDGRQAFGSSPRGRNISPAAAASRRGAAARNRSHSPLPVSGSSPFRGSIGRDTSTRSAQRSVQWACRTIDEVLTASRRLRVDTSTTTTVEELVQHILTNRYGVTPATRRMCGELASAAQQYSDVSPLCLLHASYCLRRAPQDVREYVLVAKIVGALAPWSTRESVRTATSGHLQQQHVVALRRYISEGDVSLALRDAVAVMLRKGSTLASGVRRYVTQWLRQPNPTPPIAFDFNGYVDGDALAVVLMEGLRQAKADALQMQQEYGEFLHSSGVANLRGHSPENDIGDDGNYDAISSVFDTDARRPHGQSEDLVDVILQRRRVEEVRNVELAALQRGGDPQRSRNHQQLALEAYQRQSHQQQHQKSLVLHHDNDTRNNSLGVDQYTNQPAASHSLSPPRPQVTSRIPLPTAQTQVQPAVRQTQLQSFARTNSNPSQQQHHARNASPTKVGRATKSSPLVVTLSQRQQQRDERSDDGDLINAHHSRGAYQNNQMGALMAQRESAIMRALEEQIEGHAADRHHLSRVAATEQPPDAESPQHNDGPATPIGLTQHAFQRSPLAASPFQADLSDMRSTLQAIEDELRRRQSGQHAEQPQHSVGVRKDHRDPFADRYEFGRAPKPPLLSPPRPHAELFPSDRHSDYQHRGAMAASTRQDDSSRSSLPPRSTSTPGLPHAQQPRQQHHGLPPQQPEHHHYSSRGTLSSSQGLQDDERLLLEQLEVSLRTRKAQQQQQQLPLPTPRRPLEMVAEPL